MRARKSDIPAGVTEKQIREFSQAEHFVYFRVMECILDGQVVGQRSYEKDRTLPNYSEKENQLRRKLPKEIEKLLAE